MSFVKDRLPGVAILLVFTFVATSIIILPDSVMSLGDNPISRLLDRISRLETAKRLFSESLEQKKTRRTSLEKSITTWIKSVISAEKEMKEHGAAMDSNIKRIIAINESVEKLDENIASLDRTINACDEWLKYHPDASPSEKRKNAEAKREAEIKRDAAESEKGTLASEKSDLQKDNRRRNALYGIAQNAKKYADSKLAKLEPALKKVDSEIKAIEADREQATRDLEAARQELRELQGEDD